MVFCRTAAEVREAHKQGKIAALIGVEGGHMIGNDIRVFADVGDLGVRYMTLSHFYNDEWADSSTDKAGSQWPDGFRQGHRAGNEPGGNHGGHLARQRQDLFTMRWK